MDLSGRGLHSLYTELLEDAVQILTEPDEQAKLWHQIAKSHFMTGRLDAALRSLGNSLKICKEIGNRSGEGTTLSNISQIYDARGDYETALEYLGESLQIRKEIGDRSGMIPVLYNVASIELKKENVKSAFDRAIGSRYIRSYSCSNA